MSKRLLLKRLSLLGLGCLLAGIMHAQAQKAKVKATLSMIGLWELTYIEAAKSDKQVASSQDQHYHHLTASHAYFLYKPSIELESEASEEEKEAIIDGLRKDHTVQFSCDTAPDLELWNTYHLLTGWKKPCFGYPRWELSKNGKKLLVEEQYQEAIGPFTADTNQPVQYSACRSSITTYKIKQLSEEVLVLKINKRKLYYRRLGCEEIITSK